MMHKKLPMTSRTHTSTPQGEFGEIFDRHYIPQSPTLPDLSSPRSLKLAITPIALKTKMMADIANAKLNRERIKSDKIIDGERSPSYKNKGNREEMADLMETLGFLKSTKAMKLPTSIDKLKEVVSDNIKIYETEETDRLELGRPVRRRDVHALADWLDMMLKQVLSEQNEDIEQLFEGALLIYNVCFHEIVRQVSVQCVERGELINRVWKAYLGILERALRIVNVKLLMQSQEFLHEKEEINARHLVEKTRILKEKDKLYIENEKLLRLIKIKGDESDKMTRREEKIIRKLEILQKQYENAKKEILYLKEDNRVLEAKLNNTDVDFIEKPDGVIEMRPKKVLKIRRKKADDIDEILRRDPLVSKVSLVEFGETEKIIESIEKNHDFEAELFSRPDFRDQEIDAPVILVNEAEQQTDVVDLCGESIGEKYIKLAAPHKEERKASNFKLVDLIAQQRHVIYEEDEEEEESDDDMLSQLEKQGKISEEQKEFVLTFQDKIDQVNSLIIKMRENFIANTQDSTLAQSLLKSISKAITKGHEQLDAQIAPKPVEAQTEPIRRRGRLYTTIQKVRAIKKLSAQNNVARQITYKVLNTPVYKLKRIMIKKMLLRFITQFYDVAVMKKIDPETKTIHMPDIVIDAFNHKYGMPKVVETKYQQLLSSCIKYKSIKRIYIFGRFLRLYDDLTDDDLMIYADCLNFMRAGVYKDIQADWAENLYIPYEKAVEYHKTFWNKLSLEENDGLKKDIEKIRQPDKQAYVDFDAYYEQIIDRIEKKREVRMNFIKCIYEAADFNGDGFLEYTEFQLLVRHISATNMTDKHSLDLFNRFSELFTGEQEEEVKALSFDNFSHLTLAHQVFTIESLNKFAKIFHEKGSLGHLQELSSHIDEKIEEFRWRLSKRPDWSQTCEEYEKVLMNLAKKVKNPTVSDSVWVGYRLMDEESKFICIQSMLSTLLPKCSALMYRLK
ncbi:unnamed protein product [Blepharisma stoltei]|uniref:EF-hand domain-containing protein n=1 Tax=Blepharisma stoltei TaxID=1481888 RepID=A0AAU9JU75_9CILI|nr:unnamed protein product [Blepharisma stoltei]